MYLVRTKIQDVIIKSANRVYTQLGRGYTENIYQKGLFYELLNQGLIMDLERHINVKYTDSDNHTHVLSSNRIDIFVHGINENHYLHPPLPIENIIIELKATKKEIDDLEITQAKKYIREANKDGIQVSYAMILNFSQSTKENLLYQVIYDSL